MIRLSRCCTPVPGDEIVGFVTRGRGVSVHRADCANAAALADRSRERLIEVEWDQGQRRRLRGHDRGAGLRPVPPAGRRDPGGVRAPPQHRGRPHGQTDAGPGQPHGASTSSWPTRRTCESLISALKHLDGVFDAYRQLPGKKA